jgi:hypothetical protein
MITANVGSPKVMSATGTVKVISGRLIGFFCNSTTSGTLVLRDGGASGTAMSGTITPSAGTFYQFPATFGTDLHVTIANTLNVTFFVQ